MKTSVTFCVISFKIQRILRIRSPPALSGHAAGMARRQHLGSPVSLRHYSLHGGRYGPRFSKSARRPAKPARLSQRLASCTLALSFPFLLLSQNLTHRSLGNSGSLTGLHPSARLLSSSPPPPRSPGAGPLGGRHSHALLRPQHQGSDSLSGLSALTMAVLVTFRPKIF